METQKIITYSAIGVAGIVCLVFLLDLAAGIFGRNVGNGHHVHPRVGLPSLARGRDDARAPLTPLFRYLLDNRVDQAVPGEFSRFDRHGPAHETGPLPLSPGSGSRAESRGRCDRGLSGGSSSCRRRVMAGLVSVIQSIVPAMIRSTTGSGSAGTSELW